MMTFIIQGDLARYTYANYISEPQVEIYYLFSHTKTIQVSIITLYLLFVLISEFTTYIKKYQQNISNTICILFDCPAEIRLVKVLAQKLNNWTQRQAKKEHEALIHSSIR